MADDDRPPTIPRAAPRTAGVEPVETSHRVRVELPAVTVRQHTRLYADADLGDRVRAAGGPDAPLRYFFATRLALDPPLAPVVGPAAVLPSVVREVRRSFAEDLADRGVGDVERAREERLRTDDGRRVRLTGYRGAVAVGDEPVAAAGWVGVRTVGCEFRVAGGGYPEARIDSVGHDPSGDRDALMNPVQAVS